MFECRKPCHYADDGAWELENTDPSHKPVIVILNPKKVYEALIEPDRDFTAPRMIKLVNLDKSTWFELPEIRHNGAPRIKEGRHRTTRLAQLKYEAYPVVTRNVEVQFLLNAFGAPEHLASKHFDWSGIPDYPVFGI